MGGNGTACGQVTDGHRASCVTPYGQTDVKQKSLQGRASDASGATDDGLQLSTTYVTRVVSTTEIERNRQTTEIQNSVKNQRTTSWSII